MKANVQKKKMTGNGFLLLITIALFVVNFSVVLLDMVFPMW